MPPVFVVKVGDPACGTATQFEAEDAAIPPPLLAGNVPLALVQFDGPPLVPPPLVE